MPAPRRLLPLAVVILAAAAAVPASSPAAGLRQAAFTVSFTGTVQTDWNVPKYKRYETCYDTFWVQGSGSETWNVRSKGAQKVLAFSNGVATQLQFGSWRSNADTGETALDAKGETTRTGGYTTTYTAGTCGTGPQPHEEPPAQDCGTRLVNYEVQLNLYKNELTPDVLTAGNGIREKIGYDNCTLVTPDNYVAGTWPAASGKLTNAMIFGKRRSFTVTGKDSWTAKGGISGLGTTTTKVTWKATFTRAKKARRR